MKIFWEYCEFQQLDGKNKAKKFIKIASLFELERISKTRIFGKKQLDFVLKETKIFSIIVE